jgi:transketolase
MSTDVAQIDTDPERLPWLDEERRIAACIRRRVFEMAVACNGGYVIQGCSSADILATLYTRLMRLGPVAPRADSFRFVATPRAGSNITWGGDYHGVDVPENDRFVVSPAHYAMAVYAALVEVGRLPVEALEHYNHDGSTLEMIGAEHSPGIEVTGGSLGQALSVAVGRALWRSRSGASGRIWALISDGELQEGQTWEAFQAAAAFGLGNLRIFVDANGWQVDGQVEKVMPLGDIGRKIASFGCACEEVDGHDVLAIEGAVSRAPADRPLVVLCRTDPTYGYPAIRDREHSMTHFIRFRPGEADLIRASSTLPWK